MIPTVLNGMVALMMAKLMLNDLPHAAGITKGPDYGGPPTPGQLRYIAIMSQQLGMPEPHVETFGEAGLMITELKAEKEYRRRLKHG